MRRVCNCTFAGDLQLTEEQLQADCKVDGVGWSSQRLTKEKT